MTKWQVLYVKIDAFWDAIPAPIKVPIYQAVSALLLLLIDKFVMGKIITPDMWRAILSAFVANEGAVLGEYVRKNFGSIEQLKVQYNKDLMDR